MKMLRIETPGIAHYAYVIASGNEAAVVDPGRDAEPCLKAARELGVQVTHVVEAHRQEDFGVGSAYLARLTGAQVVNGKFETFGHGDIPDRLQVLDVRDLLRAAFKDVRSLLGGMTAWKALGLPVAIGGRQC